MLHVINVNVNYNEDPTNHKLHSTNRKFIIFRTKKQS